MKPTAAFLVAALFLTSHAHAAERTEVRVRMSDGVELATDVYLPSGEGPFPTVLVRTPYGKSAKRTWGETFSAAGYATVIQDVRGKFGSGGTFVPFLSEERDGIETLDWIASSTWSNGDVAIFGASYLAHSGLVVARRGHPSLRTVFSASGWLDPKRMNAPGGASHIMLAIPWLLFSQGQTQRSLQEYDVESMFRHLPLSTVFSSAGIEMPAWSDRRALGGDDGDSARPAVPIFHITGWYDFVATSSFDVWRRMQGAATQQRLVVGPWIHDQIYTTETVVGEIDAGPESVFGMARLTQLAIEWFDCHLRERCTDAPPVRVFVLGENRWRDFTAWPPKESRTLAFHLGSGGNAATRTSDGRLTAAAPKRAGADRFRFDPNDPVPTLGGATFHFFPEVAGPRDQREIERRADVAVYTTPPLTGDLLIAGPIRAVLHVSTEGRDTDFTAKLSHVSADGRSLSIVDGIVRLSARSGSGSRELLEPGRIYEVTLEMGDIAITIPEGDRLRLAISSSNFPKFDRNPNTGADPFEATELVPVAQTIHYSKVHPSRLEITAIELPRSSGRKQKAAAPSRDLRKATPADPSVVRAGVEMFESGRIAEARMHFETHVKRAPGAALLHFWLGRALLAEKKTDAAIDALERATALDPTQADSHLWLGRALVAKLQSASSFQQAMLAGKVRRAFEKAVELDPGSIESRTSLAGYYLNAPGVAGGSAKRAKEQLEAVVALDPTKGHGLLGRMHAEKKEWAEAEASYLRALEHEQAKAEIHFQMGRMYQDQERWPEAAASFEAAIAADPEMALAWYQLGRTGAMSGTNLERSLEALEIYIGRYLAAADPTYRAGAWWRKGMILEKQGKTVEALVAYEQALAVNPSHEQAAAALARLRGK